MRFNASCVTQISALALGIGGALASAQSHASAFQLKENSVKAQGRAMAGSASAAGDSSVVANNPAVMSTFSDKAAQLDVTAIDLTFNDFRGGGVAAAGSPLQSPLAGGNGGNGGGVTPVPAMSFVLPLQERFEYLTLGMMVSAPFGLKTDYDKDWVGRYHAVESDVKIIDLTLAASVELSERFSIGIGAVFERAEVTLTNAVDFGSGICRASAQLCVTPDPINAPFGPQKNDGFAKVKGKDTAFGWLVGLNWRPVDSLSLGYSHRSEIDLDIRGDGTFTVPGNVRAVFDANPQTLPLYRNGRVGAQLVTPSVDILSATWQVNDSVTLMAEAARTDWHSMKEIRIQFDNPGQPDSVEDYNWKDTWMYSLGGEFKLSQAFTLRAGIARDESPIADEYRTPRMPDQDRNWYAIGMSWTPSPSLELSASYTRIQLAKDPRIAQLVSSSGSLLDGKFNGNANLFGLAAQYRF